MNFGFIVKRKNFIQGITFILIVMLIVYVTQVRSSWKIENQEPDLTLTWDKFHKDCGGGEHSSRSQHNYNTVYHNKVVQWSGIVLRVDSYDETDDNSVWISDLAKQKHLVDSVEILVNMFSNNEFDVLAIFDTEHFVRNQDLISSLHTGTVVTLTGTVSRLASRANPNDEHSVV